VIRKKGDLPRPVRAAMKPDDNKAWTKMERRGPFTIVLAEPSNGTETAVRHDYSLLYWSTRQLEQWGSQLRTKDKEHSVESAKREFEATILVGDNKTVPYVTDDELNEQINHWEAPSVFAKKIIARRWKFTPSTVATIVNRKPKSKNG
jgi:hypothetical protein